LEEGRCPRMVRACFPRGSACPVARRATTMSMMSSGNSSPPPAPATEPVSSLYDTRLPQLSRWRRMQIPVIAGAVIAIIRVLGPTLRFEELGMYHYRQSRARGEPVISAFWHRCIISATWYWRNRGVVVMNTTNFDGQWTRRVIEHFGFGTAQGSSTRGGLRGLAVMARRMEEGFDSAFTIDGPRGPRYVAKPGPVMLARKTGRPIYVFHIGVEKAHTRRGRPPSNAYATWPNRGSD
jgi:lysophospholipid acyltransferase (LPLAT)-like uncharacterized protein